MQNVNRKENVTFVNTSTKFVVCPTIESIFCSPHINLIKCYQSSRTEKAQRNYAASYFLHRSSVQAASNKQDSHRLGTEPMAILLRESAYRAWRGMPI